MRLAGKVAVITGGASGIGLSSARIFAAEGARLVLVDRDPEALAAAATELGVDVLTLNGDVGDEATVEAHAAVALARFGRIDVLLTCAGISTGKNVADCDLAAWEAVLRVNLTGTFLWSRAAIRAMRQSGGGSIVLVSSQLAFAGGRANAAYLASKGAVVSLGKCMALDHVGDGIRVNVVVPGAIETPMLRRSFGRNADPAAARARSVARHPMGRLGQPEEVAKAALFLASDESSFTTGSCVMVDGGWLAA
jgi:NAD(P)-dependent dehydrogenase (short-subunit alcohol dehydrogenase family)